MESAGPRSRLGVESQFIGRNCILNRHLGIGNLLLDLISSSTLVDTIWRAYYYVPWRCLVAAVSIPPEGGGCEWKRLLHILLVYEFTNIHVMEITFIQIMVYSVRTWKKYIFSLLSYIHVHVQAADEEVMRHLPVPTPSPNFIYLLPLCFVHVPVNHMYMSLPRKFYNCI